MKKYKPVQNKAARKVLLQPPTQRTLHDTPGFTATQPPSALMETWGHVPSTIDMAKTFRVLLQHPRGFKLFSNPIGTQYSLFTCQSMGIGAVCLPETNTNWQAKGAYKTWMQLVKKTWQHSSCITSFTKDNFESIHQPGGTAMILTD
jgi:hypothetical protein